MCAGASCHISLRALGQLRAFLMGLMCAGASCPISLRALGQLRTFLGAHVRKCDFDHYWNAKENKREGRDDESPRNRKLRAWQKQAFDKVELAPDCRLHATRRKWLLWRNASRGTAYYSGHCTRPHMLGHMQ